MYFQMIKTRILPLTCVLAGSIFLTQCSGEPKVIEVTRPNCEMIAQAVVDQMEGRDETYFKNPKSFDSLKVLEESEDIILCYGFATLSDGNRIRMNVRAHNIKGNWSYQASRGSSGLKGGPF